MREDDQGRKVVFKIDFEKAYDHVRWDFLDQVLEKKGFSPKWRKWMNGCLSSVSYAVLVNGSAKEERNMLEGFRVGRNRTRVSHLQFADDTIFFSNTREEDLQTLKSLLLAFGHISGLKVNLDKSNIYGINLDQAHISRLAETLDARLLAGLYYIWVFLWAGTPGQLPASVAAKIERLQRDFLWSGIGEGKKDHLVRWDVVCKPKEIGGLGFGNISLRNLALLGKWLWRYPREGSALWHQVILSIYGSHSNGWDANTIVRWSHLSLEGYFSSLSRVFLVYSICGRKWGKNSFWEDLWWGDQPLGSQYPSLFRVVLDKNIPISSVLGPTRPFSWNLNFRRNLSDSEIEDLEGLMRLLMECIYLLRFQMPDCGPLQSFIWLVAHKKVNTNDMLQVRRPYKALSPDICILCMKHGESADHIFLHCSLTIGLWHRLFQLAKMDWVPPRSILDMMYIKFNGFGSSKRGIALWQAANIALIRIVWRERNARIFEDKARNSESLWDSIVFLASLWAYCSKAIKNVKANAAGLTRANNAKPEAPKPESSTVLSNATSEPSMNLQKAQLSSGLPADFFDNHVTKKQKSGNDAVKFLDPDSYNKTGGSASAQTQSMEPLESKNNLDRLSSSHSEKMGKSGIHHARDLTQTSGKIVGSETKEVKGALPEGFFDNKDADLRARGIVPVKPDVKDEYKEFEKLIQEDLKEVDNRLEEEEFDAAEMIEEAESVEQKVYWEKVEMLKKKKLELKAARSGRQSKEPEVSGKGHSSKEDSSSDDDSDGNFMVDWRAQHL
ncbi:putative ribonuclease H protein [Vitis vinifera]|uniref:Putative ribonuclease H protein n=1 Tax=Vitis vinifera TaxID=29760 RepID=A0A438JX63_VITVI|nr:putative ribonuclease H protein [Vitis vinifera]